MRGRGFYGNVTNASKSQFVFDRHYPNRKRMDENMATDGVFIGRYVLIEYDYNDEDIKKFYKTAAGNYATTNSDDIHVRLKNSDVAQGEVICIPTQNNFFDQDPKMDLFYQCIGFEPETNIANFKVEEEDPYTINYHTDMAEYGAGRGYDSTVWQKVANEGTIKYVMIAELNSVVPTFEISADAPTMEPLPPHFDGNSTNVYYNMHVQNPYGFRVQKANPTSEESLGEQVPSDIETTWDKVNYDPATGEVHVETSEPAPAAIYFNKAGFNDKVSIHDAEVQDAIEVKPTGISGKKYNSHNGQPAVTAPDIQELKVILPSIGNSVATMWDIIYGTDRNQDINWDSKAGHRAVQMGADGYTFTPEETKTLAGCINSVHDLMGMIIEMDNTITPENADLNKIYYKNKEFYYVRPTYKYTPIKKSEFDAENGVYYVTDNALMPQAPLYSKWNNVLGYKKGLSTAQDAKELVKMEGFAQSFNTIHGLIIKTNQMLNFGNEKSRDTKTVQGCINTLNDIIASFGKYKIGDVLMINNSGQIDGASIITNESSIAYWNEGTQKGVDVTSKPKSILKVNIDGTEKNSSITLNHANRKQVIIPDSNTTADTNTGGGNGLNAKADGKIELYTPILDNFGHVVARNTESVKLPNGYQKVETNGTNNSVAAITPKASSTAADTPYSGIHIDTGNNFIETAINNNILTIGHKVGTIEKLISTEGQNQDSVKASFVSTKIDTYDEAGHITKLTEQTVNFPYSYGRIKVNGQALIEKANQVQDTLNLTNTDKNLTLTLSQDSTLTINHGKAQSATITKGETSTRPVAWGDSFKTLQVGIDDNGHVSKLNEYTITLPHFNSNSTKLTDSSVVAGMTFDSATGSLESSVKNVGDVKLAGYVEKVAQTKEKILPTDTLSEALAKLNSRLWTIEDGTITDAKFTYLKNQNLEIINKYGEFDSRFNTLDGRITTNTNNIAKNTEDIASILGGTAGSLTSILAEAKEYTDGKVTLINQKDDSQDLLIQANTDALAELTGESGKVKAAELADKATADGAGNNIVNTYETKIHASQTYATQSAVSILNQRVDSFQHIYYTEIGSVDAINFTNYEEVQF